MKTIYKSIMAAGVALGLAACSQTDDMPASATGDISLRVVTAEALDSRGELAVIDGYQFKCVMQLLDRTGATVGEQTIVDATDGTADFTIKAADIDAGANKAIFWAEYVPTGTAPKIYDSRDLTAVCYATTDLDLTDAAQMAATDAYCGVLSSLKAGASVTLARPLSQVSFQPNNPDAAAGQTKLVVKVETPSAFNVLTGKCAADQAGYQAITLTNDRFSSSLRPWWKYQILCPADQSFFANAFTMELSGAAQAKSYTIPGGKVPMDPNYIYKLTGTLGSGTDIDVDVNDNNGGGGDEPVNPDQPGAMAVGSFVDAEGNVVASKDDAVAIVISMDIIGSDRVANYDSKFAGKAIKAYAVALENTNPTPLQLGKKEFVPNDKQVTNGSQPGATEAMLNICGDSPWGKNYTEWVAAHPLKGDNVSGWYVPIKEQVQAWLNLILKDTTSANKPMDPTGDDQVKAYFTLMNLCGVEQGTYTSDKYDPALMVASSTINTKGYPSGGRFLTTITGQCTEFVLKQVNNVEPGEGKTEPTPALCRPMFTIFQ